MGTGKRAPDQIKYRTTWYLVVPSTYPGTGGREPTQVLSTMQYRRLEDLTRSKSEYGRRTAPPNLTPAPSLTRSTQRARTCITRQSGRQYTMSDDEGRESTHPA